MIKNHQISEDMRQLTIARLRTIPKEYQITIGSMENISRDEIIENVINDSEIGKKMIDIQMDFLRDMAQGDLYKHAYE